jgi:hypothetical protein
MLAGAFRTASRSVARFTPNAQIASRNFATYKSSTGLVGLAVDPNGRETLQDLAQEILVAVKVRVGYIWLSIMRILTLLQNACRKSLRAASTGKT